MNGVLTDCPSVDPVSAPYGCQREEIGKVTDPLIMI